MIEGYNFTVNSEGIPFGMRVDPRLFSGMGMGGNGFEADHLASRGMGRGLVGFGSRDLGCIQRVPMIHPANPTLFHWGGVHMCLSVSGGVSPRPDVLPRALARIWGTEGGGA